ncbi:hypothetical protein AJ80_02206 [Polytolypa hystricis UAMH7299]|uniref:Uncharacterized protein n=1 Tax=Polytolypa hystricis (strain UAMH7299) TaxID=1447883 RepID=A0A2B7YQ25_POLH7|nr:hypothetical protein AJ80_02206 [Polytolypa hystricis UAMH7299]
MFCRNDAACGDSWWFDGRAIGRFWARHDNDAEGVSGSLSLQCFPQAQTARIYGWQADDRDAGYSATTIGGFQGSMPPSRCGNLLGANSSSPAFLTPTTSISITAVDFDSHQKAQIRIISPYYFVIANDISPRNGDQDGGQKRSRTSP